MSLGLGSMLVGVALVLVTLAYLARPFRWLRPVDDLDRAIEQWVAQARPATPVLAAVSACPACGRTVGPEDRFCPRCGKPLEGAGA